jgi:cell wall-associated NlpC family hydrolase
MNIEDYIGIPFDEYNCWDLYRKIMLENKNIELPDYKELYKSYNDGKGISDAFDVAEESGSWIKVDSPEIFDIIVLKIQNLPWHFGIYIDTNKMLHTLYGTNSCLERLNSLRWQKSILGYWRYVG